MDGTQILNKYVRQYSKTYGLKKVKIYDPYDLIEDWPNAWPFAGKPGIYVFLNRNKRIIYVGKASINNTIAARLSAYFVYGKDGKFRTKRGHNWTTKPRYVVAVTVNKAFEAPSLEEFLIGKIKPEDNTRIPTV